MSHDKALYKSTVTLTLTLRPTRSFQWWFNIIGYDLLPSAYEPNLTSLSPPVTKICKATKNEKLGWFGLGSLKLTGDASFDRAHMSSY